MILRRRFRLDPFFAGVSGGDNQAARAHGKCVLAIENVQSVQRVDQSRWLMLPTKSTISCVENQTIGSDGPSMQLIAGKTNCTDRVALWLGVLPLPPSLGNLCVGAEREHRSQQGRETKPPG